MKYNRSLDFLVSAAVKLSQGKQELAAKLMLKATREPSFAKAVQILEASNEIAFKLQAKAAAAKKQVRAAEEAEDSELEDLVGDMDDLESEGEAEEAVEAEFEPEGEPEEVEDEALEIEEDEEPTAKFARMLASMEKKTPIKAAAKRKPVAKK